MGDRNALILVFSGDLSGMTFKFGMIVAQLKYFKELLITTRAIWQFCWSQYKAAGALNFCVLSAMVLILKIFSQKQLFVIFFWKLIVDYSRPVFRICIYLALRCSLKFWINVSCFLCLHMQKLLISAKTKGFAAFWRKGPWIIWEKMYF